MKSLSLHLLFNVSKILPSVGLFVFVPSSISAVARFFFSMQLLVRLNITKYSCLFGSLCRKLLQWKINEWNPFRPAVILFGYPYQLIQFAFLKKKFVGLSQPCYWFFSSNSCSNSGQLATVNLTSLSNFISRSSLCYPVHLRLWVFFMPKFFPCRP